MQSRRPCWISFALKFNHRPYLFESSVGLDDWTQDASLAGDGNEQIHTVRTDDVGFFRLRVELTCSVIPLLQP
jgi:hypothetical protein